MSRISVPEKDPIEVPPPSTMREQSEKRAVCNLENGFHVSLNVGIFFVKVGFIILIIHYCVLGFAK